MIKFKKKNIYKDLFFKILKEQHALLVFLFIFIVGSSISSDFRTILNLTNLARQVSVNGVLAIGMTIVIMTGGIDLSIESVAALSSILIVILIGNLGLPISIMIVILFGFTAGMLNGITIAKTKASPIIITLGTWILYRGLCLVITEGNPISGKITPAFRFISEGNISFIPMPFILFILLSVTFSQLLKRMPIGRSLIAIGGSMEASLLVGINIQKTIIVTYTISGITSSIGGIILGSRLGVAQPLAGVGFLLYIVAAVVLGGTNLQGGKGTIFGTVMAVLTLGLISNLFNMTGLHLEYQKNIYGAIVLIAIIFGKILSSEGRIRT